MSVDALDYAFKALIAAARAAARSLSADFFKMEDEKNFPLSYEKISDNGLPDFVTDADIRAQALIKKSLFSDAPHTPFYGEEGGGELPASGAFFLVDPLDGTSNFMARRPYFSMALSYIEDGSVEAAVIANPLTGLYVGAIKGRGACKGALESAKEERSISARPSHQLRALQLDCEFPMIDERELEIIHKLLPNMSGLRKSGSTALDIFHQVSGYKSAVISSYLRPHDIAACLLIASEAGFTVTDIQGKQVSLYSDSLVCARPEEHRDLLRLML